MYQKIFLSPNNLGTLWPREIHRASSLHVGVPVVLVLEDEDEVAGGDDAAGAALSRHLVGDGHLVAQALEGIVQNVMDFISN